jgi:hypothetical protein
MDRATGRTARPCVPLPPIYREVNVKNPAGPGPARDMFRPVNDRLLAVVRIGFAGLVAASLVTQIANLVDAGVFNPTRFFLFFTVLSNLFAASVFLEAGRRQLTGQAPVPDLWRGASVVFMTVTFIVFAVLLRDLQEELQTNVVWVDTVLHRIMPVAVMADWLIEPPHGRLTFQRALVPWLVPPLAWTGVTMVRGAVDGWYPYPFLDPADGGYGAVILYAIGILLLFVAVIWVAASAGTAIRAKRRDV